MRERKNIEKRRNKKVFDKLGKSFYNMYTTENVYGRLRSPLPACIMGCYIVSLVDLAVGVTFE